VQLGKPQRDILVVLRHRVATQSVAARGARHPRVSAPATPAQVTLYAVFAHPKFVNDPPNTRIDTCRLEIALTSSASGIGSPFPFPSVRQQPQLSPLLDIASCPNRGPFSMSPGAMSTVA
jgi:hypothetical protein